MRKILLYLLWIVGIGLLMSCTETIDTSQRYVFKDETILSYLQKHDSYTAYVDVLKQVPISKRSKSTVYQLLSARGNFTVFAPTNEAIEKYLQQLANDEIIPGPSWDAITDSTIADSIRKVIVYNSIIDGGDEEYYETSMFPLKNNGEFARNNMNEVKLSVFYGKDLDSIYINRDCPINPINRDIRTINGMIHQMEKVIAPTDITLAGIFDEYLKGYKQGFLVMAKLCEACGLMDTLSKRQDEVYEQLYLSGKIEEKTPANGLATMTGGYSYAPAHRKYGFTIFAEPDSFWESEIGKPAAEITPADVQAWVADGNYYPQAIADENYKSAQNMLYQWTTYHVLPFKMSPDRLVFHYNEKGYEYIAHPYNYSIPVMEYYVSLGKRRLVKIYESPEADGIYLNRFPIIDNAM